MTKWDMSVNACMMARTTATCSLLEAMDILECWLDKGNHIKREMHHLHSLIHYSFIQIPNPFFLCPFFIFHIFILLFSPFQNFQEEKGLTSSKNQKRLSILFENRSTKLKLHYACIFHSQNNEVKTKNQLYSS